MRPVLADVPGDHLDRRPRELEVDRLPILGVALGDDQVDALAAGDQILAQVYLREIAEPQGHDLQERDRRDDLSHNRFALGRARVPLDLAPDALWQAEKQRDRLWIIKWAEPLPILRGQSAPANR
jgi:hypothetical protein